MNSAGLARLLKSFLTYAGPLLRFSGVAWLGGLIIGLIHFTFFYQALFHGDTSSRTLLAEAMVHNASLFPTDFYHSTGFGFLSQAPIMAVLFALGVERDMALIFGSALNLGFWAVIIFLALAMFRNTNVRALSLTLLALIPIGVWEAEFLLGQQSSLPYVSLALVFLASSHRYVESNRQLWLVVSSLSISLLSVDSLARALIVVFPTVVILALWAPVSSLFRWGMGATIGLLTGLIGNLYLTHSLSIGYSVFSDIHLKPLESIWDGTLTVLTTFGPGLTNVNFLAGFDTRLLSPILYVAHLVLLVFIGVLFVYWTFRIGNAFLETVVGFSRARRGDFGNWSNYVAAVSVLGIWVGAVAVAMFYPDSGRQFLWAFFIAKIYLVNLIWSVITRYRGKRFALVLPLAILSLSWWSSHLVVFGGLTPDAEKAIAREPAFAISAIAMLPPGVETDIQLVAEETGLGTIYGEDFWTVMPLNTLLPEVSALVLMQDSYSDQFFLYRWLTRPSLETISEEVMYLVICSDRVDEVCEEVESTLRNQVKAAGGTLFLARANYEIWVAPPIWR